MAEPEKCPDCGERDCGGAPRFKGLSAYEKVQLREKEAAERAVCCPEGVRFQEATGQHGNDHPGECDWTSLPYDQWPRWESYDLPDGKVAFRKRDNSEDTCLCSSKTGRECLHHMNRRREMQTDAGVLRVPGQMPAMRGVGPRTNRTFGPARCGNPDHYAVPVIPTNPEDQKVVDDLVAKSQRNLRTRPLRVGEETGQMKLPTEEDVANLVEQAKPKLTAMGLKAAKERAAKEGRPHDVTYEGPDGPSEYACQAEDQGGWPCGAKPVVWQLTAEGVAKHDGKQMYFCKEHRTNKFVWKASEVEPITYVAPKILPTVPRAVYDETCAQLRAVAAERDALRDGVKNCPHPVADVYPAQLEKLGTLEWCQACGARRFVGGDWDHPTYLRNWEDYAGRNDQAEDRTPGEDGGGREEARRPAARGAGGGGDPGAGAPAARGGGGVEAELAWFESELLRAQQKPRSGQSRGWNAALLHLGTSVARRRAEHRALPCVADNCKDDNAGEYALCPTHLGVLIDALKTLKGDTERVLTAEYPAVIEALARVREAGIFPIDVLESAVKGLDPTADPRCVWCKGTGVAHDANMVPGETAICPCTTGCEVCRRITSDLKSTEPCTRHGLNVRVRGESGTLDGEAHPHDVSDEIMNEAERYAIWCIRESREPLPFNSRYLLSMIREIRRSRKDIEVLVDQKSYMLKEIREIGEQRPVAACEGIPLKVRGFEVRVVDHRDRASLVVALDAVKLKVENA